MLWQELRFAMRSLRRSPGLTVISVLTVGLGVGAGTSLFTVVKSVLLDPLPFPDSERLVWATSLDDRSFERLVSLPDFDDWRAQNRSFSCMAAYSYAPLLMTGGEEPERPAAALVTEDFFDVLGVRPMLGRSFAAAEHEQAPLSTVILGHAFWERAFGGDASVVGRAVRVMGLPSTVIGVMPRGFGYPAGAELWLSARAIPDGKVRTAPNYQVVGRLRPGVTDRMAAADLGEIAAKLKAQYPAAMQAAGAEVIPLARRLVGSVRTPLLILFGAVGVLLLIVCVNVATLLLVRLSGRARELAVRMALGASSARLFRQLLLESLVLAAGGGILGCVMAVWSMDLIRLLLPDAVPRASEIRIDAGVIGFAVALTTIAGLLFGTLPAWRAGLLNVHDALKSGVRGGQTAGRATMRTQALLVVSEVALSMLLVAGASLLLGSFVRLRNADPGFRTDGVIAASIVSPVGRISMPRIVPARREILDRLRALPGVESAGLVKELPLDGLQRSGRFRIENGGGSGEAGWRIVGPGALEALRVPLVRGRRFMESDTATAPHIAIVNEEMARRFWPGRDPIGERIWFDGMETTENWLTVVGVAADVRQNGLTEAPPPQAYVCYTQVVIPAHVASTSLVVKSGLPLDALAPQIRRIIREVDPETAVAIRTMDSLLAAASARQRFQLQVLAGFAAFALILAAVGLYGVLSYIVASSRPAFGIRLALGASPADILRVVLLRAAALTGAGTLIGLGGCLALRGVLAKLLYGVAPTDPGLLGVAAAVLLAVALLAGWFPARRAMQLDPLSALRDN
jgi:putative ABC transport system permease protein